MIAHRWFIARKLVGLVEYQLGLLLTGALLCLAGAIAPALAVTPRVAGGSQHSCALTSIGTVKCWGANWEGQLGDGTQIERYAPVDAAGITGAIAITAGHGHTCALTSVGGVKCWGSDFDGELGDKGNGFHREPVDVIGLAGGAQSVAAGGAHTCAVTTTGGVKCWGANDQGQLGTGTTTPSSVPVDVVSGGETYSAVSAGGANTCALTVNGGVKCWGSNDQGQLGNGTSIASSTPVAVSGLGSGVAALTVGGFHVCALTDIGGAKCWGGNEFGQLGDNSTARRETPVDVAGLSGGAVAVSAGYAHSCALVGGGAVRCWGDNGAHALGNGNNVGSAVPVDVVGLAATATDIASGGAHTCAMTSSGGVKCWGFNYPGQLGNSSILRAVPSAVAGLVTGVAGIAAGGVHSCARIGSGILKCWGGNGDGELGDGTTDTRLAAIDIAALPLGTSTVVTGFLHTCAVSGGGAKCWGRNANGQLGDNSTVNRSVPTDVAGLGTGVVAMAAGRKHSCALTSAGGVKCWGLGGVLGYGGFLQQSTPVDVIDLAEGAAAVAAGYFHTCVVTTGGGAKCWGDNSVGQLGDNSGIARYAPVEVTGIAGATAVAAGEGHTCALTGAGGIKCWGHNDRGQLGDNSTTDRWAPIDVAGLTSGVLAVAAGGMHTCALLLTGGMKCWGANELGQLGDDTLVDRLTPVEVVGLGGGAAAIAAGYLHTCAVTDGGAARCWGDARAAQLGDDTLDLYGPASFVVNLNALGGPAIDSSANPSITRQTITLTATVAGLAPTGTVVFQDGAASIPGCDTVTVVGGQATCVTSALQFGTHFIAASYSGDANNPGATSSQLNQGVVSALDADGNGTVDALTDGLLIIRHLFGLSGSGLAGGAIGPGAKRDTAALISGFLAGTGLILDIDGDGHVDALTDGVLILRYLLMLRGAPLIDGAMGDGSTRKTAEEVGAYLGALTGN